MLLTIMRLAKDWAKKESQKDGSFLSGLWSFIGLVPKGEALSLVVLCLLTTCCPQIYDDQITAIGAVAATVLIWKGRRWLRWPLLFFSGYLVFALGWHFGMDDGMNPKLQAVTAAVTGRHTLFVILLGSASIVVSPSVNLIAPLLLVGACSMTLIGLPTLGNPSTNAAMIVLCLPYCRKWWMWLLTMWIAISQQGATAWLMLSVISFVRVTTFLTKKAVVFFVFSVIGMGLTAWLFDPSFFLFYDRWDEYKLATRFWLEFINPWMGAGLGSFQILGPVMQKWDGRSVTEVWMSLHSDVLQLVFELGVIGAVLAAWLLVDSILRAEGNTRLSMIAACLFGLFYFPMQIPLVAFFLIVIVVQTQKRT